MLPYSILLDTSVSMSNSSRASDLSFMSSLLDVAPSRYFLARGLSVVVTVSAKMLSRALCLIIIENVSLPACCVDLASVFKDTTLTIRHDGLFAVALHHSLGRHLLQTELIH